jgi:hypothetical protein
MSAHFGPKTAGGFPGQITGNRAFAPAKVGVKVDNRSLADEKVEFDQEMMSAEEGAS